MSVLSECHKQVDHNGVGKCSVPMWCGGMPDGFCDNAAFGFRPEGKTITRWDGHEYREDGLYAGYISGLACPQHGGPKLNKSEPVLIEKDESAWCAKRRDSFTNLQDSNAGFGETPQEALQDLLDIENKD